MSDVWNWKMPVGSVRFRRIVARTPLHVHELSGLVALALECGHTRIVPGTTDGPADPGELAPGDSIRCRACERRGGRESRDAGA